VREILGIILTLIGLFIMILVSIKAKKHILSISILTIGVIIIMIYCTKIGIKWIKWINEPWFTIIFILGVVLIIVSIIVRIIGR
jgi:energy-converting hydrogenase Eha subunit C